MTTIEINDEYLNNTIYDSNGVFLRRDDLPEVNNKFELLYKTVEYLTGEHINSKDLRVIDMILPHSVCICSCNKCDNLAVIQSFDGVKFGVGSVCVKKFGNRKLDTELYYYNNKKVKRCEICNVPLVRRTNGYMQVNADRNEICCYDCDSRIYLNVPFKHKDEVKKMDGIWDVANKKWYIWRSNKDFHYLNDKYGLNN